MKIAAFASSDSYLKWAAGQLDQLPAEWPKSLRLIRNTLAPSPGQIHVALEGTSFAPHRIRKVSLYSILTLAKREQPDYLFLAMPSQQLNLVRWLLDRSARTRGIPIISGFPGIAIGQSDDYTIAKATCSDLLIAQSLRELDLFSHRIQSKKLNTQIVLSSFPLMKNFETNKQTSHQKVSKFVFAPQATVPESFENRMLLLTKLLQLAKRFPKIPLVLKLRARTGEAQTHWEEFDFFDLYSKVDPVPNVSFEYVSLERSLTDEGAALLTVSSTAAIEAIALGRAALLIEDFGINDKLLNEVFRGSGLFVKLADLNPANISKPELAWVKENYFHRTSENSLKRVLENRVARVRTISPFRSVLQKQMLIEVVRALVPSKSVQKLITKLK